MLELYENIRKFRIELNMSQAELAKRTGYGDRSSIAKIERGAVDLPQSKIMLFANALNVTPGKLMGDVEPVDNWTVTKEEKELIDLFRRLNPTGQQQARAYIEDLTGLEKYTEPSPEAYGQLFA